MWSILKVLRIQFPKISFLSWLLYIANNWCEKHSYGDKPLYNKDIFINLLIPTAKLQWFSLIRALFYLQGLVCIWCNVCGRCSARKSCARGWSSRAWGTPPPLRPPSPRGRPDCTATPPSSGSLYNLQHNIDVDREKLKSLLKTNTFYFWVSCLTI